MAGAIGRGNGVGGLSTMSKAGMHTVSPVHRQTRPPDGGLESVQAVLSRLQPHWRAAAESASCFGVCARCFVTFAASLASIAAERFSYSTIIIIQVLTLPLSLDRVHRSCARNPAALRGMPMCHGNRLSRGAAAGGTKQKWRISGQAHFVCRTMRDPALSLCLLGRGFEGH